MKIDSPRIGNLEESNFNSSEGVITGNYNNQVFPKEMLGFLEFEGCHLENITMNDLDLSKSSFVDAVVEYCDLSNCILENVFLNRVCFKECRLTGTNIIDSSLNNVVFDNCILDYANFSGTKENKVSYNNSKINNSSFNSVIFKNVEFNSSELNNAEFIDTKLAGLDFRTDEINNILVNFANLKDLTVSPMQAIDFAGLLGINVK